MYKAIFVSLACLTGISEHAQAIDLTTQSMNELEPASASFLEHGGDEVFGFA